MIPSGRLKTSCKKIAEYFLTFEIWKPISLSLKKDYQLGLCELMAALYFIFYPHRWQGLAISSPHDETVSALRGFLLRPRRRHCGPFEYRLRSQTSHPLSRATGRGVSLRGASHYGASPQSGLLFHMCILQVYKRLLLFAPIPVKKLFFVIIQSHEAWPDLQLCPEKRLQCSRHGSTSGRLGRVLSHVRVPQWPTADHEGQLLGQGRRPQGDPSLRLCQRETVETVCREGEATSDTRKLSRLL